MSIELAAQEFYERCANRPGGFDGIYRPEPWLSEKDWRAVAYVLDPTAKPLPARRLMDDARFEREDQAQARCDELNATRMDVSTAPKRYGRLI